MIMAYIGLVEMSAFVSGLCQLFDIKPSEVTGDIMLCFELGRFEPQLDGSSSRNRAKGAAAASGLVWHLRN